MPYDYTGMSLKEIEEEQAALAAARIAAQQARQQETATIVGGLAAVAADLDQIIGPEPVAGTTGTTSLGLLLGFTATQAENNVGVGMLTLARFIRRLAIYQRDVVTVINNR